MNSSTLDRQPQAGASEMFQYPVQPSPEVTPYAETFEQQPPVEAVPAVAEASAYAPVDHSALTQEAQTIADLQPAVEQLTQQEAIAQARQISQDILAYRAAASDAQEAPAYRQAQFGTAGESLN